jgi:hypothetical protein
VDAAIAILADTIDATAEICRIGKPIGTTAVLHNMVVHKRDRNSGCTIRNVDDPSIEVLVTESEEAAATPACFVSQFRVVPTAGMSPFGQPGDSRALVIERNSQNAVGLLFACPRDNSYAYCNPISEVLSSQQISLEV